MPRLYLVLWVLAGVPVGASRTVLCLAPNRHVAIEMGDRRCVEYVPPARRAIERVDTRTVPRGCADCVDIPVGTPAMSQARGQSQALGAQESLARPFPSAVRAVELPSASLYAPPEPGAGSHSAFPPSRTTVLRS